MIRRLKHATEKYSLHYNVHQTNLFSYFTLGTNEINITIIRSVFKSLQFGLSLFTISLDSVFMCSLKSALLELVSSRFHEIRLLIEIDFFFRSC